MIYTIIYRILDALFQFAYLALMIRVVLSWIPHNPYHSIISFLYQITDPILKPFRDMVPSHRFGIDLSPIFAFMALGIIRNLIFRILF